MNKKFSKKQLKDREIIMERLCKAGIKVETGEKKPVNGRYSGIIGERKGERIINIDMNHNSRSNK
ncbi:hypothetical protein [Paraliobacillus sp. X-1268]|uniref:hypothetical protein n=1 Tax=Paraliobacillus sp. X-1268 TaxID=2213193 RepID=UPI000E3DAC3D|nr:hypothetical protein [Paraliobacillus sp. X-1268]